MSEKSLKSNILSGNNLATHAQNVGQQSIGTSQQKEAGTEFNKMQ
ncbi:hypothetical protein [Haloarcula sediminis]|nr:hypothetical protein [Haloarcula sp. CK38]